MRKLFVVLLVSALVFVAPGAADAENATVNIVSASTIYTGSSGIDHVSVSINEPPTWVFLRGGTPGAALMSTSTCDDVLADGTRIACGITGTVLFNLNGGNDRVSGGADGHAMTFNGGAGEDQISVAGNSLNGIDGGEGNDRILVPLASNQNTIEGGAGADKIEFPNGPDQVNGGPGADTVIYSTAAPVSASLDDAANDGANGSPPANLHSDVENLTGAAEEDSFMGSAAANVLASGGASDRIEGGPGPDTITSGEGTDSISASDGERDTIDCGLGDDTVVADAVDVVGGDCEHIELAATHGGDSGSTAPTDVPASKGACIVPKLIGRTLRASRKKVKRSSCTLGKVRGKRSRLTKVSKQSPKSGRVLPAGSKVNVRLG